MKTLLIFFFLEDYSKRFALNSLALLAFGSLFILPFRSVCLARTFHALYFFQIFLVGHTLIIVISNAELLLNRARKVHGERTSESMSQFCMHMKTPLRSLDINATFTYKNCFLNLNLCWTKWMHDFSRHLYRHGAQSGVWCDIKMFLPGNKSTEQCKILQ